MRRSDRKKAWRKRAQLSFFAAWPGFGAYGVTHQYEIVEELVEEGLICYRKDRIKILDEAELRARHASYLLEDPGHLVAVDSLGNTYVKGPGGAWAPRR